MEMLGRLLFILTVFLLSAMNSIAQTTTVYGKVKDAENGDPVPFANVIFKGTIIGTTTTFDGDFTLTTGNKVDTLLISYVGYLPIEIPIRMGQKQEIHVQLLPDVIQLKELVIHPGENPAFKIMRQVHKNRKLNAA